jgi:8-hydroxy-5-deazaflavin:NADPH oxidoreductase
MFSPLQSTEGGSMKIGVLGTGTVGETIASKLVALGHEVCMGSRSAGNEKAAAWAAKAGATASAGTFADCARYGEVLFNCTKGGASLEALRLAGAEALGTKVLVDVANPLDGSKGFPPSLAVCNTDSLGESIQREFPRLRVVKALNTINCKVMVEPARIPGVHAVFMCGNDAGAKEQVGKMLREWFGWKQVLDLGDITNARGTEMYLPLWVRLYGVMKTADFNVHVVKA